MPCDTLVEGSPGNKIKIPADFPVAALAVVALVPAAAGTRRVTVQQTSHVAGVFVRVRPLGGAAGTGFVLGPLGSISFGGGDGGITTLEVEGDPVAPATVAIGFEGSLP